MRKIYLTLILFLSFIGTCRAQIQADTIYRVDRSKFAAVVDEVAADELIYYLPEDAARQTRKNIALAKVWRIVYGNGETEVFNPANPAGPPAIVPPVPVAQAPMPAATEPVIAAPKPAPEAVSTVPTASPAEPAKPNEIIIKIQHEPAPGYAAAPQKEPARKYKNYVGFRFGGMITSFYSEEIKFPEKPFFNWETGLGISLANKKHYNARLELMYANKGSRETITDQGINMTSRTKIRYAQANLLPLILKSGARKLNPAIGVGGYYAYRISHKSEYRENDGDYESDDLTQELIDHKFDYGACVMLAFYSGHKPLLEFRYEYGLADLIKGSKIRNNGLSASLFLSF